MIFFRKNKEKRKKSKKKSTVIDTQVKPIPLFRVAQTMAMPDMPKVILPVNAIALFRVAQTMAMPDIPTPVRPVALFRVTQTMAMPDIPLRSVPLFRVAQTMAMPDIHFPVKPVPLFRVAQTMAMPSPAVRPVPLFRVAQTMAMPNIKKVPVKPIPLFRVAQTMTMPDSAEMQKALEESVKPVISVRNLRKSYNTAEGPQEILHGISFDILPNEFVVILGASGTGKTTLLNILGGLDSADSGTVTVAGNSIEKMNERKLSKYRRRQVGFIFQFYSLLPSLTVKENLESVAKLVKKPMDVHEALDKVGLWEKRNSFPSQLSSGQQQRVAIARALVKRPGIILADEPTGALDLNTSRDVLIAMDEVTSGKQGTILLITHNPEIARIADRVITMSQGNISSNEINQNKISAEELRW